MRPKDKPGTFRVTPKGGRYLVSGVTVEGDRVKFTRATQSEAEEVARSMFGGGGSSPTTSSAPLVDAPVDDWGLPLGLRVNQSTLASFAPKVDGLPPITQAAPATPSTGGGLSPLPAPPATAQEVKDKQEKVDRKRRRAESLAGLIGMGGAWGSVYTGRKWCEANDQVPVKPDPKQTNEMADSIKDGITETFGDREVGPWTMAFLLGLAIPISMKLQSRKMAPEEIAERDRKRKEQAAKLRSVP